jgi:UDP-N-acetylglucosamine 2-epimerase
VERSSPSASSHSKGRRAWRPLVVSVFGTRPQLIKLAVVWGKLQKSFRSVLIDSGQHYDAEMAGAFYSGERIRKPDVHLGIRARTAPAQVAKITDALDKHLRRLRPDAVITFGDTSTTVAAALAASYNNIDVAHVEAGMRSYDLTTPEEKNRLITDHVSRWLFCATRTAIENLAREGLRQGVFGVGDVMYETFLRNRTSRQQIVIPPAIAFPPREFYLVTCHRAENVDHRERLRALAGILTQLDRPAIFAVHPRARKNLIKQHLWQRLKKLPHLRLVRPLGHDLTLALAANARAVLTDSGGLQREAYWLRSPCLTLRDRTEWVETVACGANRLVDLDAERVRRALSRRWHIEPIRDPCFRRRAASDRIIALLLRDLSVNH